jgi:hypothetical protein
MILTSPEPNAVTPVRGIVRTLTPSPIASPIFRITPVTVQVGVGTVSEVNPAPSGTDAAGSGTTSAALAGSLDASPAPAVATSAAQPATLQSTTTTGLSNIFGLSASTLLIIVIGLALLFWVVTENEGE